MMGIDTALRHYLKFFILPGEAQKVDRLLMEFSEAYINDNPGYHDKEIWHCLSYLLMMLHTAHHNPNVIEKMTLEEFQRLALGIHSFNEGF